MTAPSKYPLFAAEVVQAELIHEGRPLSAEQAQLLDDLESRLRTAWRGDPCMELRGLLRRMKTIRRARKPVAPPSAPAELPPAAPATKNPEEQGPRHIHRELSEMAAKQRLKQQLSGKALQRLEAIMNNAASRVAHDAEYRHLYLWALRIHERASKAAAAAAPRVGTRTGKSHRGLVQSPGLMSGGREVLCGLPSSRRGH